VTPNIHYENREIEGERLELTDNTAIYWLGPNITLRRCTVVLGVPGRWLSLVSGRLIDCTIQAIRLHRAVRQRCERPPSERNRLTRLHAPQLRGEGRVRLKSSRRQWLARAR